MEQICGYIERITFHNTENGYTVAQLQQPKRSQLVCIVGSMPGIQPGETVRCYGQWKNHLIHGRQFEVDHFTVEAPADLIGIKKYLGSGLVKGIGHKFAGRIVDQFGVETLDIIEQDPARLLEIPGLGAKRMEKIKDCWTEQKAVRQVMIFLQGHGVSPAFAQKIFKSYGDQSVKKVKENPYALARDIFGIGFKSADAVAEKMGIAKESNQRIDAGIEFVLSQLSNDGHVCYPVDEFSKEAEKTLEVPLTLIDARLEPLKHENRVELADLVSQGQIRRFVWTRPLFMAEMGIARELKRLKRGKSCLREIDPEKAVNWVEDELNIELAVNQKQAVSSAITGKLHIITGGPGTGKSTITKAIFTISEKLTQKIHLQHRLDGPPSA